MNLTAIGTAIGVTLHNALLVWAAVSTDGLLSITLWTVAGLAIVLHIYNGLTRRDT